MPNPRNSGNKNGNIHIKLTNHLDDKDIKEFVSWIKKNYKKNPKLATWYGDHIFGKAPQPLTGADGGPLTIVFDSSFDESSREAKGGR